MRKIRKHGESDYYKRIMNEIVKPIKQAAEHVFKKHGLKKPMVFVLEFVPENKTKSKIDIMKKKVYPRRPK